MRIPEKGLDRESLFEMLEEYRADDADWRSGKVFGYVYHAGSEAEKVAKQAYMTYLSENALDPTVYPSLLRFENEVVAMARSHLRGDEEVVGNFTSGGTESIILAVKAARDRARALKPDVTEPEMILPITAHASFHKAAHYLCVKPVIVPVDPVTFEADIDAVKDAVTPNTILLVGSAPCYSHGVIDPIRELGRLAIEGDLSFHVDGCIGAFLLPYFRRLGVSLRDFDFTVPGVTSISMDLHKYAYAAKGASVILYRNKEYRQYQIFSCSNWTGYTVINSNIQSSRTGGPIASAWTVLHFIGEDGYMEIARSLLDANHRILEGLERIDDLRILGSPVMGLIAVTSDAVSVFHVIDEMKKRGWYIQPQLSQNDYRENFHLSVNPSSLHLVDQLLDDLRECVENARSMESGALAETVREMFSSVEPEELTDEMLSGMLKMAGMDGFSIPEYMADINEIMNALPRKLVDRLLCVFFNELFQ